MPHLPRVLLVGDSGQERDVYAVALQRQGFCTLLAESAADAYRLADELLPAAVVTDVHLSGAEDGLVLARQLKQRKMLRGVPVVVLTGAVLSQQRDMVARTGCDLVLPKPCAPHVLSSVVAGMIRRRRAAGASTT
jgi:DNA-binding response OmpR family regulator